MALKVLDLFAGIGGFALGLDRCGGYETVAFVERDAFCQSILKKNYPEVPVWDDINNVTADINGNLCYINENGEVFNMAKKGEFVEKYANVAQLYESGMSIGDCAKYYGVTRQAMHKVLKRRNVKFRSNLKYQEDNHFFRHGNGFSKIQKRAGHMVEKALKKGVLIRADNCEVCGETNKTMSDGRSSLQGHHDDYGKPLDVRWLCQKCHHEWHKTNQPKGVEGEAGEYGADVITAGFP